MSEFDKLSDIMKKMREEKNQNRRIQMDAREKEITQLQTQIAPVIEEFVQGDQALTIQSSNHGSFFISYGFLYVCKIEINIAGEEYSILMTGDPEFSRTYLVAIDDLDSRVVQRRVKEGLLDWYQSCLS